MLVKGQDPSRIFPGSTLSADGAEGQRFDYMLANPPFGVDWADDYDESSRSTTSSASTAGSALAIRGRVTERFFSSRTCSRR